jgi:glycine C-acetyltransferase
VPKDHARVRVQLSAAHSSEDVSLAIDAFGACGKALGII